MALGWPLRPRTALVVAIVVVVVAAAAGFRVFERDQPALGSPGGDGVTRFVAVAASETSYVVDGIDVCLDRPGRVRITDVSFVTNQGGARVVDWGVRSRLLTQGARPATPATLPGVGTFPRTTVARTCGGPTDSSELAIEVRKSTSELGLGMDLRIAYDSGPFSRELEVETDVVLCGPSDRSADLARACAAVAAEDPTVTSPA